MEVPDSTTEVPAFIRVIVGVKAAQAIGRKRRAILLATLVLLVLANPIADATGQTRLIFVGLTVVFLLSCLQQVDGYPHLRWFSRLLVLLWVMLTLLAPWSGVGASGAAAALAMLILVALWLVAQSLIAAEVVDAELLCSALGAYLLLGVFWAETYEIIDIVIPAAFAGPGGRALNRGALFYFSFTTLTSTGFGDILAVNPVVRMWAVFEAIAGTMYNAVVIARLVSLYGSRTR